VQPMVVPWTDRVFSMHPRPRDCFRRKASKQARRSLAPPTEAAAAAAAAAVAAAATTTMTMTTTILDAVGGNGACNLREPPRVVSKVLQLRLRLLRKLQARRVREHRRCGGGGGGGGRGGCCSLCCGALIVVVGGCCGGPRVTHSDLEGKRPLPSVADGCCLNGRGACHDPRKARSSPQGRCRRNRSTGTIRRAWTKSRRREGGLGLGLGSGPTKGGVEPSRGTRFLRLRRGGGRMAARPQSSAAAAAGPTARATNRPLHRVAQEGRARRRTQVAVRDSVRGRRYRPRRPAHAFILHVCGAAGRHRGSAPRGEAMPTTARKKWENGRRGG
jgi:hypothetical protein